MPRLFIALPFNEKITKDESILNVNAFLLQYDKELKVVPPENYHITLKFFGECSEKKSREIQANFNNIKTPGKKIPFVLSGLGVFPDLREMNVIWAGIRTDETPVHKMLVSIDAFSDKLGFKKEKRAFTPHLTLARVRNPKKIDEQIRKYIVENKETFYAESSFDKIALINSKLDGKGPVYTEIASIDLDNEGTQKIA